MGLYDLSNRIRAFGESRRLNVGTAAKPRWIINVHAGDDYAATYGHDNVYAVQPGTVIFSGKSSTYGWHVQVRLSRSIVIRYHSLASKSPLSAGDTVKVGGYIGLTGASASGASGNHVHIQAEDDGKPINPRPYLSGAAFNPLPVPASNTSKPLPEGFLMALSDAEQEELLNYARNASHHAEGANSALRYQDDDNVTGPIDRKSGGVLKALGNVARVLNANYDSIRFTNPITLADQSKSSVGGVVSSIDAVIAEQKRQSEVLDAIKSKLGI